MQLINKTDFTQMKNRVYYILAALLVFTACDKIKKPYLPVASTELDQSLYPGVWSDYPWPTFGNNPNTNRNILLEDYTGHKCVYCPAAAVIAAQLETDNPNRVFVASMHTSPGGMGPFQSTDAEYVTNFLNPQVIDYGVTFANGFGFDANPKGTINRKSFNGTMFQGSNNWSNAVAQLITENDLRLNIQASSNYFPETRGFFMHTEIDTMSMESKDITVVSYLIEESFISKQKFPGGVVEDDYHHHNVHRGNIDGKSFGRVLNATDLKSNGKFYQNYSFHLPVQYDPANTHVLVYVMNRTTYEIYQTIKVKIQ
jgi:hypothetical protein